MLSDCLPLFSCQSGQILSVAGVDLHSLYFSNRLKILFKNPDLYVVPHKKKNTIQNTKIICNLNSNIKLYLLLLFKNVLISNSAHFPLFPPFTKQNYIVQCILESI